MVKNEIFAMAKIYDYYVKSYNTDLTVYGQGERSIYKRVVYDLTALISDKRTKDQIEEDLKNDLINAKYNLKMYKNYNNKDTFNKYYYMAGRVYALKKAIRVIKHMHVIMLADD